MTPDQKTALKQALDQHSFRMSIKDAAPEDIKQLPEDFQVPSYSANASPIYDNQLFPKITSADDLIKLGYATPEGVATENGEMAISLKKAGALNDDYTLNDTGKAMMANPADLLEEENLPLYNKAKELDLDGSGRELSWGERYTNFEKEMKEGAKNLALLIATATPTSSITGGSPYAPVARTAKEQAALNLEASEALGGLVKSGAQLATGVSKIAGAGAIRALADSEAEERLALSMFDQRFEKIDRDIQASRVSEVIDAMGQMAGAELGLTEARKKNIELVGKEEAAAIEKRGESAGQFAGMINPYGAAAMTGKVAFGVAGKGLGVAFRPISRSLLQADSKAALVLERTRQLASLERRTAGFQAAAQAAERQAVIAESMAEKFSKAGLTDRANNALKLANQSRGKGQEALTRVGGFTDEITKVSDDLAKATQSAGVADKVLQMGQVAKQIPYLPIVAIGKTLELTGRGMIGIDKGLSTFAAKVGADKAYNAMNRISSLSGLGGAGAALGLGPVAFIPAAARLAWSTAPYLKAAGEYVSLVGKEASKARGQIGFWKRIYEMPNKGPAHRMVSGLMDTATAGGLVTGMGSRVTKGLLASYPVDLAYEWVSEGGDLNPNVFKQAAVETLFFGGTGAALGGITMGSANRIKQLQNGDALNFYSSISDPAQRLMYNGMPSDLKRVVGTFSASNPGAKIQFVDQGLGAYDRNTKTVMINPNAPNPLKPLLTHEFMHHMLNNGIGDGVIAQLVGDGFQTGGLLRGKDGSYDAQYSDFKEEYVGRLRKQHEREVKLRDAIGDPMTKSERDFKTPDEKYLAEEYFIETNVDDMLGLVESGKLGKMAGRMIINDKVRALGDSILNKSSILRDLHFRIGGVIDNSGKMVTGNGFLGGKLYQSPEVRRMFQKMVSESVGRRGGIDAAKRKAREGVEIPIQGKSDPILGELGSLWESDSDGSPLVDGNGDFVPLKKETDELRSQAGLLLVDDLKARQNRGETIPDGELAYNPENNTWSGQYLNDRQIELLSLSGRFNSKQIKQLKLLNEGARQTSDTNADPATRGHRFSVIYQSALKKNRKGQWKYDQIKPQLRDVVPYGVEISKDGNILIRIMSTNQLFANVSEKAASKRGRMLYDGNMETILRDANAIIDLHGKNQATDAYFKEKYGGKWETHKSFINSVFGNVGKGHKDINPLVASDRVDAVVKSYRLDRMNKATQLVGSTQLPYQNNMIKINYLPEGEPIMDANGEPKDLRNTPRYEATSQVKMPEQRQMPEGEAPAPSQTRFMPEGVDEDGFYSQLDKVITDKVPNRATVAQIMATIDPTRGSGVKADEIKWSGVEQALASLEKDGKVSKEDLLNYLRNEGNVRFEEVTLSDPRSKKFHPGVRVEQTDEGWFIVTPTEDAGPFESREQAEAEMNDPNSGYLSTDPDLAGRGEVKFAQYVLPGGENYREVVLAMPSRDRSGNAEGRSPEEQAEYERDLAATGEYRSSHFPDIPNYVAHMRVNERTDANGMEGLFAEEFQSDRHQEGRKKGYALTPEEKAEIASLEAKAKRNGGIVKLNAEDKARWDELGAKFETQGIADAPFRTTWPLQLFKRLLRDAVDSGKDWVGWTVGDTQNERFDLSKSVDFIKHKPLDGYPDGSKRITIQLLEGRTVVIGVDANGRIVSGVGNSAAYEGKTLEDVIGKDVAARILAGEGKPQSETAWGAGLAAADEMTLRGNDLKMGGSGMRGFYDTMQPKEVGKYVKQWGGKVEKGVVSSADEMSAPQGAAITNIVDSDGTVLSSYDQADAGTRRDLAQRWLDYSSHIYPDARLEEGNQTSNAPEAPIWRVNITPEMRKLSQTGQMRYLPESGETNTNVDNATAQKLDNEPTLTRYRAMALIDGKLYPPMSTSIGKSRRPPEEIGKWMKAEERPDLVPTTGRNAGNFRLKGPNGDDVWAIYAPYFHSSSNPLNDQFSAAYKKPLVTVEVEIPANDEYQAKGSKRAVGEHKWAGGRMVNLSRYAKIKRIVPDSEVASLISKSIPKGTVIKDNVVTPSLRRELEKVGVEIKTSGLVKTDKRFLPEDYKSHHDETLLRSAWNGKELDLTRPFKASESLPSLAMRTNWNDKPLVNKDDFDFTKKARVIFGKNKNGDDVTIKFDPNLLNIPSIVDFADVYTGEQIQYTIADRMSAVDGDMGGALHAFLKNNDVIIEGPDGRKYKVGWGNNSSTVGTKMRRKAKDGAKVLMVYLMGNDAHQSNTRTVRLFDTQLENSSMPSHMVGIARAYSYIAIKEIKYQSAIKEVERIDALIQKAKKAGKSKRGPDYIDGLKSEKNLAIKESQKIKVSSYENELSGIFRKVKSSQTRLSNGLGKQSTVDANIEELINFAASAKGKKLIGEIPSKFIYEMTGTFDGRKSAVSQISNLKLSDFDGPALSAATADMETGDKNAVVAAIDLSDDQDFFMLYMGNDPKQANAMTASEKAAAANLKQNNNFVIHEAYDTLILSPLDGRRNLNSRMENALDAVPDSFQDVLDDRPSVKAQVGKTNAKGNLILSEDNLLNTVRDQQSVPLIYNPKK